MNKKKEKVQQVCSLMLLGISSLVLFTNCINKDYKFDQIDWTLGFGGDKLVFPANNSTSEIILDDILKIENSDIVSIQENGDYLLSKSAENVDPISVSIDPITTSSSIVQEDNYTIQLPEIIKPYAGKTIDVSDYDISGYGEIAHFDYEYDAPEAVMDLEYVDVMNNGTGCDFFVYLSLSQSVVRFEHVDIYLPDFLQMTWENSIEGGSFDATSNILRLNNYQLGKDLELRFNITRIYKKHSSNVNYADFKNGHLTLKGTVFADAKIATVTVPDNMKISFSGNIGFEDMNIIRACGVFDPEIAMDDLGTVEINEIPDFLLDEKVVADLDNPQIWLMITSTMPLGGTLKGLIRSDTYPKGLVFDTPGRTIQIKGSPDGKTETKTYVLLCRHNPGVSTSEYQVIEDDNLSKLINKMENGMNIDFIATEIKAYQDVCTVELGHEYYLTPQYSFNAPLAFGPNAVIVYNDIFDGWNGDLEKVSFKKDSYVNFTATAVNNIPADLELDVYPVDAEGRKLEELTVELVKKTALGSQGGAVESPLEIKIIDTTGNGLNKLDGISIALKASSNEEIRGVTLNSRKQALILKDAKIELIGKVIYDAN